MMDSYGQREMVYGGRLVYSNTPMNLFCFFGSKCRVRTGKCTYAEQPERRPCQCLHCLPRYRNDHNAARVLHLARPEKPSECSRSVLLLVNNHDTLPSDGPASRSETPTCMNARWTMERRRVFDTERRGLVVERNLSRVSMESLTSWQIYFMLPTTCMEDSHSCWSDYISQVMTRLGGLKRGSANAETILHLKFRACLRVLMSCCWLISVIVVFGDYCQEAGTYLRDDRKHALINMSISTARNKRMAREKRARKVEPSDKWRGRKVGRFDR